MFRFGSIPACLGRTVLLAVTAGVACGQQSPSTPPILLNEICFDAGGVDGSARLGGEWIEVLVLADGTNLGDYGFDNNLGRRLGRFPSVVANRGAVIVMYLGGDVPPQLDGDPSDLSAAFANGGAPNDYLPNANGGVRLKNLVTGNVIDAFYWGTGSAPAGTNIGPWTSGRYFDIGFANGQPINEGESVGRNAHATNYPGSPADWSPHGGAVAAEPSPGRRNDLLHIYPSDLLSWAQTGVNDAVLLYGDMQFTPGRYAITDADVTSVSVSTPRPTQMLVTAVHSLTIADSGSPQTYTGSMQALVTIDPSVATLGYTMTLEGTLRAPNGNSFGLQHTTRFGGFTAGPRRVDYSTRVDWQQYGQNEWFQVQGAMTRTRTGDNSWSFTDTRNTSDYLNGTVRALVATASASRVSDGVIQNRFELRRPFPSGPTPATGPIGSAAMELLVVETESTSTTDGSFSSSITRLDQSFNGQRWVALQPGMRGSLTLGNTFGPAATVTRVNMTMPLVGSNGVRHTVESNGNATLTVANGKYLVSGDRSHVVDGVVRGQARFTIDPPVMCLASPQGTPPTTTTTTTSSNGTTVTTTTTVSGGSTVTTITIVVSPSQPPPPAQPTAPTTCGSGHAVGFVATAAACAGAGATWGGAGGTCVLPVIGTVAGAGGGAILGGVVCGGGYLIAKWFFDD